MDLCIASLCQLCCQLCHVGKSSPSRGGLKRQECLARALLGTNTTSSTCTYFAYLLFLGLSQFQRCWSHTHTHIYIYIHICKFVPVFKDVRTVQSLSYRSVGFSWRMWGHAVTCSCTLCPSVRRLHRLIGEGTRLQEADLFVGYATVKLRNVLGEIQDFLDVHPLREREGSAPPPPEGGGLTRGRPGQEPRGAPTPEGGKAEEKRHPEVEEKEDKAFKEVRTRPVFEGEGGSKEQQEEAFRTVAAKSRSTPSERGSRASPGSEIEVKKEEEAPDYTVDDKKEDYTGVREVISESPSRDPQEEEREGSQAPKKRRHHHRSRSRSRRRRRDRREERSGSSPPVAKPSRPTVTLEEPRRPRSPSQPPPHWKGPLPRGRNEPVLKPRPSKATPKEDSGTNKGLKKKEAQKIFKEYVAWRKEEKRKGR